MDGPEGCRWVRWSHPPDTRNRQCWPKTFGGLLQYYKQRQMISRFLLGEDHCKQTGYYFERTDDYCVAHLDHGCLALPGEGGCLLLPDAGALGLVEDEGGRAVVDVWVAVHTVVVSAMGTREVR